MRTHKAAVYADVSERTLRRWLKEGLRHSRVGGAVFVSEQAVDDFLERHAIQHDEAKRIAEEVLASL